MNISALAVSRHVSLLEAHRDARLLNRTTRRVLITESGQALYERTSQVLVDLQEAEAAASGNNATPRSSIRLSCSINVGVPHLAPAIGAFQARYPQMLFDVSASDGFVDWVEEGLDWAIRIGDLGNPHLIARKLGQMRQVSAATPACLERCGTPKRLQELVKHNCLTYQYASVKNYWPLLDRQ